MEPSSALAKPVIATYAYRIVTAVDKFDPKPDLLQFLRQTYYDIPAQCPMKQS